MKSFSAWLAIICIVLIIAIMVTWSYIPDFLSNSLSAKLKVPVEIEDISLSWNQINIQKLEINNPKGCILPKAFSTKHISVKAPLPTYLKQEINIAELSLDKIYIGIEFESRSSNKGNWMTIMNNLKSSSSSSDHLDKEKSSKKVVIKKLILTDISLDLLYRKDGEKVQHLPHIDRLEFTNVTSDKGIPVDQLTKIILQQMLRSVFDQANLNNLFNSILDSSENDIDKFIEPFKKLFNTRQESTIKDHTKTI